eukprot:16316-Alexandrium_andersonii.AAC.1
MKGACVLLAAPSQLGACSASSFLQCLFHGGTRGRLQRGREVPWRVSPHRTLRATVLGLHPRAGIGWCGK